MNNVLIKTLELQNVLGFGPEKRTIELGSLNVLIGPNGSGKSNLLDMINLFHHAPGDINKPISNGGGVMSWLWEGKLCRATVAATVAAEDPSRWLRHMVEFEGEQSRFRLSGEQIAVDNGFPECDVVYFFDGDKLGYRGDAGWTALDPADIDLNKSVVSQLQGPSYPYVTYLGRVLAQAKIYKTWRWGTDSPVRRPCAADLPNEQLAVDLSNLPLVLNRLRGEPKTKRLILKYLQELYEGIEDFDISLVAGMAQVLLQEGDVNIPASRLSDGTLRFLSLLAILCHPKPAPLICIEEPELGLHPDIIPVVADLLLEASQRTQVIVTTHSTQLVDAMTEHPEAIVVCEKTPTGTTMNRLDSKDLAVWLDKYRLGDLWTKGELGGNRW